MFIYLTGYYSGVNDIDTFRDTEINLKRQGHRIVNVIDIAASNDTEYRKNRLKNVLKVDNIVMLNDWSKSDIAKEEARLAQFIGLDMEEL